MTVDAHLHVWDPDVLRYPWLDAEEELGRAFLPADIETRRVDEIIFVQADSPDGLAEARWVQSLDWPQLRGIVAFAPVESLELVAVLDQLETLPSFVGVRRLLQDEPAGFITSPSLVSGLRELATRGIPFDACIRHQQLAEIVNAAREVPELTVVLDHLGKPPIRAGWRSDEADAWRTSLRALAAENAVVKVSGLAPEADSTRPLAPQIAPFVSHALDAFSPERLMIGGDFPVSAATSHRLVYDEWFELVDRMLALSPAEHAEAFTATAQRTYTPRAV